MKYSLIILILSASLSAPAQDVTSKTDSARTYIQSRADTLDIKYQKALSKIKHGGTSLDSLMSAKKASSDSVIAKLDTLSSAAAHISSRYADSLNAVISKYRLQLDNLTARLTGKAGKLSQTDTLLKTDQYIAKYSSKIDSVSNLDLESNEHVRELKEKIRSTQARLDKSNSEISKGLNDKLGIVQKETGLKDLPGTINLPDTDIPQLNLPHSSELKLPGSPDLKIPSTDVNLNSQLPDLNLGKLNVPDAPSNKDVIKVPSQGNISELNSIKDQSSKVSEIGSLSSVSEDINKVKTGDLHKVESVSEDDIVSKIPLQNELEAIKKQDQVMKDQQEKLKSYKNLDEYKKQTLLKARQMTELQFATYGKEINNAIGKVSEYQNKMGTILGKKSQLPPKRDPLRKLKSFERMVPGITFQIQKTGGWVIDVSPSVRYRITSYWSAGIGWNERIVFGDYPASYARMRIFGPRLFTECIIFKGFSARIDVEEMNCPRELKFQVYDASSRVNVWNYMFGIKKDFSFVRRVTGNAQFMYNVYTTSESYPYPNRYNVRFGFEYMPKRKIRKNK